MFHAEGYEFDRIDLALGRSFEQSSNTPSNDVTMLLVRMEMGIAQSYHQLFRFAGIGRTGIERIPVNKLTAHGNCAIANDGVHYAAFHSVVPPKALD